MDITTCFDNGNYIIVISNPDTSFWPKVIFITSKPLMPPFGIRDASKCYNRITFYHEEGYKAIKDLK